MRQRITTLGFGIAAVIAAGAIAFALAVGVGAVTLPGGALENAAAGNLLASSSTAPDWTSGTGGPGWGHGPGMRGYGPLQALVASNTITADQATAIAQAVRTQHEKTEAAGGQQDATTWQKDIATALDSLVRAGTITADQAAKVKTALADVPMMGKGFGFGGPGMRGFGPLGALVANGTITVDEATKIAQAFKAALPTDGSRPDAATMQAALTTALDKLVAAGTITSDQAAKVTTAFGSFQRPDWTSGTGRPDWTSGTGGPGWGHGPGMRGYGPLQALVASNTITADQATAIAQAVRTQHEKTEAAGGQQDATTWQKDIATALDSLVRAGTITADQAAKVKTALADVPMMGKGFGFGGPGMRGFGPGMDGGMHGGWGAGPYGTNPGASPAPASGSGTTS